MPRFTEMDVRMQSGFKELRSEMAQFRVEVRQQISNLHTDIVRVEQVFDLRLQSVGVTERAARLTAQPSGRFVRGRKLGAISRACTRTPPKTGRA